MKNGSANAFILAIQAKRHNVPNMLKSV